VQACRTRVISWCCDPEVWDSCDKPGDTRYKAAGIILWWNYPLVELSSGGIIFLVCSCRQQDWGFALLYIYM